MNVSTTIRERRTIRKFKPTPIAQELIVSLLNKAIGLYEADGTPHWRCLHYSTAGARQRLAESMFAKITASKLGKLLPAKMIDLLTKQVTTTPVHLVFIAASADSRRQSDEHYAAVRSIMQCFQLLGWESGLGMLWYTDPLIASESLYKEIGLREGERFAGILHVGRFEKAPRARKRTPADKNWTALGGNGGPHSDRLRISSPSLLELLNEAAWAPNDGLREPWRFIYAAGGETAATRPASSDDASIARLLIVAKEESDPHKQEEDFAAVCCLIQNFQLLAKSKPWHVRRMIPSWIDDQEQRGTFGIRPQERIAAVLELGPEENVRYSNSSPALPPLNITHL
ncbi:nitroreductase [Paenibacillus lycopersici]|uniref:Nitroreductase n=1 Tax=Paenibacillus lycopersici TaxID=2704462 RepID=A0A6C0G2B0_9BACL|nr:nitroreductase family protein [Paenibacillus lycopersici]QHT62947.1 nitroreductase [Paenibacillus lycopersici]